MTLSELVALLKPEQRKNDFSNKCRDSLRINSWNTDLSLG